MRKIATIVGARPQFIKAAAISRAIKSDHSRSLREIIIHTGQHYDNNMSNVFFRELDIPDPHYNLSIGSGMHGVQTGLMMQKTEEVLLIEKPDIVVVYGDTNTTLAGALTAAKLHLPVAHIEAGLRSFNKSMPEEINRIAADHVSTFLFVPTPTAVRNLATEGFELDASPPYHIDKPLVSHCGDVMYDNALFFGGKKEPSPDITSVPFQDESSFILCTIHRPVNTDDPGRLNDIFRALLDITHDHGIPLILPLHPRTEKMLASQLDKSLYGLLRNEPLFRITDPVSYLEMLFLEKHARLIITDSGGVQKESYFFRKPCLVLRAESEWTEIIEQKTAVLVDANTGLIRSETAKLLSDPPDSFPPIFGDGHAAEKICSILMSN